MIEKALAEIKRGSNEIIGMDYVEKLVKRYYEEGKTYTVKAGFDPTAPDLHLGHTVLLRKLAAFQAHGGFIQFLIGDFTAMIGDPSGKSETRRKLTREQVAENARSYEEQVYKILDKEKMELVFNSTWLEELGSYGMIELTSHFSVARMLERDDFEKRYKAQTPISIIEFLYPLLQGYDSVHLKSDIEIGGTDQKFNLLMGRHLQRVYNVGKEQAVLTMPILEGLDGVQKMSKSLGNYIGVTEPAGDIYGKTMSVSDELMWRYYELLSSKSIEELERLQKSVEDGSKHPKEAKQELSFEMAERFWGSEAATGAKAEFEKVFARKKLPTDMPEAETSEQWIAKVLVEAGLTPSTSQARRDIKGGALKIDEQKVADEQLSLTPGEYIIQLGKKRFAKVKIKG